MNINELYQYGIDSNEIEFYLNKIKNQESIVTLAGEFSSGKSTFFNAFVNQKQYLPNGFGECTPVLLNLVKSDSDKITVTYKSGETDKVENTYVNRLKFAKHRDGYDKAIHMLTIPVDSEHLNPNVSYIDTPGSNTMLEHHVEISNYILSKTDIVVYVFNISLSESDLERIEGILKYTQDVIFVLTHIDEEEKYKPEEDIQRFVDNAKNELESKFPFLEEAAVLPVGSILALEDNTYISEIREYVDEYLELNTAKTAKNRAAKQLGIQFDERLEYLKYELDLLKSGKGIDVIIEQMNQVETELKKLNKEELNTFSNTQAFDEQDLIRTLMNEITKSKELLVSGLNSNTTAECIQKLLNDEKARLDVLIKEQSLRKIELLITNQYAHINDEISEICQSMDLNNDFNITPPDLADVNTRNFDTTYHISKVESYISELDQLNDLILSEDAKQHKDQFKLKQYQMNLNEVHRDMMILGPYEPVWEERVIQGGGEAGARVGKVVGELADIALLFWNPAGGAAAVADGAKDAAKIANMTNKVSKGKQAAQFSKKATKSYKEFKQKTDKVSQMIPQTDEKNILDLLDYLSLGFWGESAGKFVGEKLNSSQTILEESQEFKRLYDEEANEIKAKGYTIETEVKNLKLQLEDTSSIAIKKKIKKQLESKIEYQNKIITMRANDVQRLNDLATVEKIIDHYTQMIEEYFNDFSKMTESGIKTILDQTKLSIENHCKMDIKRNIENLKETLEKLKDSKGNIEEEIKLNEENIAALSEYEGWVNEWIEAYSAN